MHSVRRIVPQGYKLNLVQKSKYSKINLTSIRQFSLNITPQRSTIIFGNKLEPSRTLRKFIKYELPAAFVSSSKLFSTKPNSSDDPEPETNANSDFQPPIDLPATVAVPEVWPHLPVIATKRNPIFPRFMKIVEVSSREIRNDCVIHFLNLIQS